MGGSFRSDGVFVIVVCLGFTFKNLVSVVGGGGGWGFVGA